MANGHKIVMYDGYSTPSFGAYRRRRRRRSGRHCRYGVAKSGRRKGQCLKHRRSRRRR